MKTHKKINILMIVLLISTAWYCREKNKAQKSNIEKSKIAEITRFALLDENGQLLEGKIEDTQITVNYSGSTNYLTALRPEILDYSGEQISPAATELQNFSKPVIYTVTAEDKTEVTYIVNVNNINASEAAITYFALKQEDDKLIEGIEGKASDQKNINLDLVSSKRYLQTLTPILEFVGSSIFPEKKEPQDFSKPVTYTVTAANKNTVSYTVNVNHIPSSAAEITEFRIEYPDKNHTILGNTAEDNTEIVFTINGNKPTSAFKAKISVLDYKGETIEPLDPADDLEFLDLTKTVKYKVTAADHTEVIYNVKTVFAPCEITTLEELSNIGSVFGGNPNIVCKIMNDIDAEGKILHISDDFKGILDGDNHIISNLASNGFVFYHLSLKEIRNITFDNSEKNSDEQWNFSLASTMGLDCDTSSRMNSTCETMIDNLHVKNNANAYLIEFKVEHKKLIIKNSSFEIGRLKDHLISEVNSAEVLIEHTYITDQNQQKVQGYAGLIGFITDSKIDIKQVYTNLNFIVENNGGGFVTDAISSTVNIEESYASGKMIGSSPQSQLGAILGSVNNNNSINITNTYFNTLDAPDNGYGIGLENPQPADFIGFNSNVWNFSTTWPTFK